MAHRVLLADDSLTIQKVVELTFAGSEWELRVAGSGDRAASLLAEFEPDAVLADAVMPGLSGYELCEAVKRLPYGGFIPVVILSGTFEPFDRARADRAGADAVITKPFDSHALLALVRDLVVNAKESRTAAPPPPSPPPLPPEPEPIPEPEARAAESERVVPGFDVTPQVQALEPSGPEPDADEARTRVIQVIPFPDEPRSPEALSATAAIPVFAPDFSGAAPPDAEPPAEKAADLPAEPFREAELPLIPAEAAPSHGWEVDLGGLEDEVPRRDVEADIAQYERSERAAGERPLFTLSADEPGGRATSVELPARGEPLPEPPSIELETLAARASLTDLTRIVGAAPPGGRPLSDDDVERVARRVVEILGERVVRKVAWDVVPEMAERLVRERLRELERAD